MALLVPESTILTTSLKSDMILGTFSGSLYSPAPAATPFIKTTTRQTISTGISEPTFFAGVFSTDGGTTWLDFNANIINDSVPSWTATQTQMMYGYSMANQFTVSADNWSYTTDGITATSSAYTFMYKVVLFAKSDQGSVEPQAVTNPNNFDTRYNYQQIAIDNVSAFSLPAGTTYTLRLPHRLGYVPKIRSFVYNFSYGSRASQMFDWGYFSSTSVYFNVAIDTTNIDYFVDTTYTADMTGTLYTRVYYAN